MKYFAIVLFARRRTKKALKNGLHPVVYLCNFNFGLVNYKILQPLVFSLHIGSNKIPEGIQKGVFMSNYVVGLFTIL